MTSVTDHRQPFRERINFNELVTFDVQVYVLWIRRRRSKFSLAAAKSSLTAAYNFITDSYDAGLQENNDYNTLN